MGLARSRIYALALALIAAAAALGMAGGGVSRPGLYLLAFVLNAIAAVVLLEAAGDPMEWPATAVTVVLPAASMVCARAATADSLAEATVSGVVVTIFTFVCVRGRIAAAWAGLILTAAITMIVSGWRWSGDAVPGSLPPNLAVLVMATLFAMIVRPRARQISALRLRAERRSVATAGARAALAVRDREMAYLDQRVRPMLERIASGAAIDDDLVEQAQLLEAALRDRIRAPGLDRPDLATAAWEARARGAKVVLLDDRTGRGDGDESADLRGLRTVAGAVLAAAGEGVTVTIRLLPERHEQHATVTAVRGGQVRRWAFDADGHQIEGSADGTF
ncbi:hypothetical protein [Gordonia sp. (in: high G+C Gram-positive bacteria)]|uniref:hypothetical protein n=1 Tax=Gordonia sp. (in: high G+C Gram-positive bacteria) TaxID=84139 RepID=UPI00352965B9